MSSLIMMAKLWPHGLRRIGISMGFLPFHLVDSFIDIDPFVMSIPRQVVSKAYAGSLADVLKIGTYLGQPGSRSGATTKAVLEVALKHLTSDPPRLDLDDLDEQDLKRRARLALASVPILNAMAIAAGAERVQGVVTEEVEGITKRIRDLSTDSIDALCRWLDFCIGTLGVSLEGEGSPKDRQDRVWKCFRLLYNLLFHSSRYLLPKFLSSSAFLDLVVRIWMDPVHESGYLFFDVREPTIKTCPLLWVFNHCADNKEGLARILETVEIRGQVHRLPYTFSRRARQVREAIEKKSIIPLQAVLYFGILIDTLSCMPRNPHDERISRAMRKPSYIHEFSATLNVVLDSIRESADNRQAKGSLMYLLYQVCRNVHLMYPDGARAFSRLIADGYLRQIGEVLSSSKDDGNDRSLGLEALQMVSLYVPTPPFITRALELARAQPKLLRMRLSDRQPEGLDRVWKDLWDTVDDHGRVLRVWGGEIDLCDNLSGSATGWKIHVRASRGSVRGVRASSTVQGNVRRKIGGDGIGGSVWRGEWIINVGRKANFAWYPHSWRSFHASLLADAFNKGLDTQAMIERMQQYPDHQQGEVLPTIEYSSLAPKLNVQSLRGLNWWDRERIDFKPRCLKPRYIELPDRSRTGGLADDVKLAEGAFYLGRGSTVFLMAMVKYKDGRYRVKYATAKFVVSQNLPPNPAWAKAYPRQILSRALAGSMDELYKIVNSMTEQNCTVEVLNIALTHLGTYDSSMPVAELVKDPLGRALICIPILGAFVIQAVHRNRILKEIVIERFRDPDAVDALCRWICMFGKLAAPTLDDTGGCKVNWTRHESIAQSCVVLASVVDVDDSLFRSFLLSPYFLDLLINVWMDEFDNGDESLFIHFDSPTTSPTCSVLWLITKCLGDEDGRPALLDRMWFRGRLKELPSTFIRRVRQLRTADPSRASPEFTIEYTDFIIAAIAELVWSDNNFLKPFCSLNYMGELSQLLDHAFINLRRTQKQRTSLRMIEVLYSFVTRLCDQPTRFIQTWRDLIAANFLTLFYQVLLSLPPPGSSKRQYSEDAVSLLDMLAMLSTFRSIGEEMLKMGAPLKLLANCAIPANPLVDTAWQRLWKTATTSAMLYFHNKEQLRLCDYPWCDGARLFEDHPSRQCSHCSSAVYCSQKCQKEDWVKWHQYECASARVDYILRKSSHEWYDHSTRMHHLKWIEFNLSKSLDTVDAAIPSANFPGHAIHEVLLIFICSSADYQMQMASLRDSDWWEARHSDHYPFSQPHLERRMSDFSEACRRGVLPSNVRLVEVVLRFGYNRLVYLTVMFKRIGGAYKAVYGLAKHAIREEP
ncbi:hypothetical protein NMY22_g4905 [Coprinellus aureogranulatus]|nr:hypothetical protein NMY22_g4905 [Coprinellus aureogranulatus]